MKHSIKYILTTAVVLFASAIFGFYSNAAIASNKGDFTLSAPAVISLSEQFRITFTIEGDRKVSGFSWKGTDDFEIVWGPSESSSSNTQIINGKMTKSISRSYSYVLAPKSIGVFTIPAATVKVGNATLTSNTVNIEVLAAPDSSTPQQNTQASESSRSGNQDIFLKLELSKKNVVVGESITAVLKLYQRTNIVGFEGASFPKFEGFWSNETYVPTNIEFSRENYGGVPYDAAVLRKYTLIPQHSGKLTIAPAEVVALVNVRRRSSGNSFFDDFFDTGYSQQRYRLVTDEVVVNVSELPAGAPSSFTGAVGTDFKITSSMSKTQLATHEAAVLKVKISGNGNISLAKAPVIHFPLDFETYDVKSSEQMANNALSGTKSYEYPIIPRSSGEFEIEPIEYTYFDTSTRKYVTICADAITLNVVKGSADEAVSTVSGGLTRPSSEGVRSLAEDIRYIATGDPNLGESGSFFVFSPLFWGIVAALLLVAIILGIALRKIVAASEDVAATKTRKASRAALAKLKMSKTYLDKNLQAGFYEELHRALVGYVCDKLRIPTSAFTKENVANILASSNVPQNLVERYMEILNICDFARYAPSSEAGQMQTLYEDSLNLITSMDSCIKTAKAPSTKASIIALLLFAGAATLGNTNAYAASSSRVDTLWNTAVASYSAAQYSEALADFNSIYESGLESPKLLTNIGDCYFKLGDEAHAIIFYRRALRLDPSYKDAKYNLEVVSAGLRDRIDVVPEFIFKTWNNAICHALTGNAWAVLCIILFAIFLAGGVFFVASKRTGLRKMGFFAGLAALLLSIVCLSNASKIRREYLTHDEAVITQGVVSVKNAPASSGATDLFILHEGTLIKIIDNIGKYYNIEIADGRNGWLHESSFEII